MWCSTESTNHYHGDRTGSRGCDKWDGRGSWSGMNLVAMVLGFVIFWPLGLFMVFWIASGRNVQELPSMIRGLWDKASSVGGVQSANYSDNSVFNDYQQTQWDRIREIKEEIKQRAQRFSEFRSNAKRRADEEEFNRFMKDAPKSDTE